MKLCSACRIQKDFVAFSKNKASSDGFQNQCKTCKKIIDKRWKTVNRERENAQARKYYALNPDKFKKRTKNFRSSNPNYFKAWCERNPRRIALYREIHKDAIREAGRLWGRLHAKQKQANVKRYKLDRIQRIPPWADLKAITEFYKKRPDGYHVDHIIPLRGKNVSGLHVLENLQYLPANENLRKGNRYET